MVKENILLFISSIKLLYDYGHITGIMHGLLGCRIPQPSKTDMLFKEVLVLGKN